MDPGSAGADAVLLIATALDETTLVVKWAIKDDNGKPYAYAPDSGIFLRGFPKAQTNIWLNPLGSGEVWGYRTDAKLSEEVRNPRRNVLIAIGNSGDAALAAEALAAVAATNPGEAWAVGASATKPIIALDGNGLGCAAG